MMVVVSERLARCVMPGCPVRFRAGPPRPCPMHDDEDYRLSVRAAALGVTMAEVPGERGGNGVTVSSGQADDGSSAQ